MNYKRKKIRLSWNIIQKQMQMNSKILRERKDESRILEAAKVTFKCKGAKNLINTQKHGDMGPMSPPWKIYKRRTSEKKDVQKKNKFKKMNELQSSKMTKETFNVKNDDR